MLVKQNIFISELVEHEKSPEIGSKAYIFSKEDIYGDTFNIKNSSALLIFLSSACESCIRNFPIYQVFFEKHSPLDIVILAVTREQPSIIRDAFDKHGLKMPVISDTNGKIFWEYHIRSVPTLVLIDRDGRIAFYKGYDQSSRSFLEEVENFLKANS